MKIIDVGVEWFGNLLNEPRLKLLVDTLPKPEDFIYEKIPLGNMLLYIAEKDGYVSFFVWSGKGNDGGFGGYEWAIKVRDEQGIHEEVVRGPWSSRSGVVNRVWEKQCVEVLITNNPGDWRRERHYYAGYITVEKAKEAMKLAPWLKLLKVVDSRGEIRYIPIKLFDPRNTIQLVEMVRAE
jgi:hypothetical protein